MNVLKPSLQTTIKILLSKGISHREIKRKTGINRRTIRHYARMCDSGSIDGSEDSKYPTLQEVATGSASLGIQNTPPRPPASEIKLPKQIRSACESHRDWIEEQVRRGRNAMAIYQDLVELHAFTHRYNSVKRFVRLLKKKDPERYDRLEFLMAEEAQVDYGQGAPTLHGNGKYRRPRLFIMTLRSPGRLWARGADSSRQWKIPAATSVHHDFEVFRARFPESGVELEQRSLVSAARGSIPLF